MKFRKQILTILLVIFCFVSNSQTHEVHRLHARQSIQLRNNRIDTITNDTTLANKSTKELMTEWAVKTLVQNRIPSTATYGYANYTLVTGETYTATLNDYLILANAGITTTINLPNVTTCIGKVYEFSFYNVTTLPADFSIICFGSQNFDIVGNYSSIEHKYNFYDSNKIISTKIMSNGTKWVVLQGHFAGL